MLAKNHNVFHEHHRPVVTTKLVFISSNHESDLHPPSALRKGGAFDSEAGDRSIKRTGMVKGDEHKSQLVFFVVSVNMKLLVN
jgi:hypothetical protein